MKRWEEQAIQRWQQPFFLNPLPLLIPDNRRFIWPLQLHRLRDNGNHLLKKGSIDEAIQSYSKALEQLQHSGKSDETTGKQLALFYSNRSFAYTKAKDFENAVKDALSSISNDPQWPKGYYRLGTSYFYLKRYRLAYDAAKQGLEMAERRQSINLAKSFVSLIDQISYSSVLDGYYGVFDGRHLQVCVFPVKIELVEFFTFATCVFFFLKK